jgi:hypothetical protein
MPLHSRKHACVFVLEQVHEETRIIIAAEERIMNRGKRRPLFFKLDVFWYPAEKLTRLIDWGKESSRKRIPAADYITLRA